MCSILHCKHRTVVLKTKPTVLACNNTGHRVSVDESALCQARGYGGRQFNTERLHVGLFMPRTVTNFLLFLFCIQRAIVSTVRPIFASTAARNGLCLTKKIHLPKRWHIPRASNTRDPSSLAVQPRGVKYFICKLKLARVTTHTRTEDNGRKLKIALLIIL